MAYSLVKQFKQERPWEVVYPFALPCHRLTDLRSAGFTRLVLASATMEEGDYVILAEKWKTDYPDWLFFPTNYLGGDQQYDCLFAIHVSVGWKPKTPVSKNQTRDQQPNDQEWWWMLD